MDYIWHVKLFVTSKNIFSRFKMDIQIQFGQYLYNMFQYIHKWAGFEKEVYQVALDFTKDVMHIKGDTDLDLKIP